MQKKLFILPALVFTLLLGWFNLYLSSSTHPNEKATNPPRYFYFPWGSTNTGYYTYFTIQNVGSAQAEVYVKFYGSGGNSELHQIPVAAKSTYTVNAASMLRRETDFATVVMSGQNILVERWMFFNYQNEWTGGHSLTGPTYQDRTWYFAEGTTRPGFETWITVMNTNESKANVKIDYALSDGSSFQQKLNISGSSYNVIDPMDTLGEGKNFSTKVTSDIPVVAERAMYYNYQGYRSGGFTSSGINEPASNWYFAEGTTRPGFETWVVVQNTNSTSTEVNLTYRTGSGTTEMQSLMVPAGSQSSIFTNDFLGPGHDFSIQVSGDSPIIAERSMYYGQGKWNGSMTSTGTSSPGNVWYFAEGRTGPNWDTWITVQNVGETTANVEFSYFTPEGIKYVNQSISSQSHIRVNLEDFVDNIGRISAKVESDQPIVAERAMYFKYTGKFEDKDGKISWTGCDLAVGFSPELWERYSLSGFVRERTSDTAVKNAKIKIIGKSKDVLGTTKSTKSDKNAWYILSNVPSGKYKLIVRKSGYYVYRDRIKINFPLNLDVQLEKK